jgi:hypothetical protein
MIDKLERAARQQTKNTLPLYADTGPRKKEEFQIFIDFEKVYRLGPKFFKTWVVFFFFDKIDGNFKYNFQY